MKVISTFDGTTVESKSIYDDGTILPHTMTVAPIDSADYWACWNGQAQAFKGCAQSCLAAVEDSLRGLIGEQRDSNTMGKVYCIFRPKNATQAAWKTWTTKWVKRTASGNAY